MVRGVPDEHLRAIEEVERGHPDGVTTQQIADVDGIQHWGGKARWLSNGRWLERATGAAPNRDRSKQKYK